MTLNPNLADVAILNQRVLLQTLALKTVSIWIIIRMIRSAMTTDTEHRPHLSGSNAERQITWSRWSGASRLRCRTCPLCIRRIILFLFTDYIPWQTADFVFLFDCIPVSRIKLNHLFSLNVTSPAKIRLLQGSYWLGDSGNWQSWYGKLEKFCISVFLYWHALLGDIDVTILWSVFLSSPCIVLKRQKISTRLIFFCILAMSPFAKLLLPLFCVAPWRYFY